MVLDEEAQSRNRIRHRFQLLFETLEHAAEAVILNQKQQLFFRAAVVIQAREAHVRRA